MSTKSQKRDQITNLNSLGRKIIQITNPTLFGGEGGRGRNQITTTNTKFLDSNPNSNCHKFELCLSLITDHILVIRKL